jgi:hypothetical protein
MRAALIIDRGRIDQWQLDALIAARDELEIVLVLDCRNTRIRRSIFRHFVYYVVNALMMHGPSPPRPASATYTP